MKRSLSALLCVFVLQWCAGCGGSSTPTLSGMITVNVSNTFAAIEVSGAPVNLTAVVAGDTGNHGVTWSLTLSGSPCYPGCGTLKAGTGASLSAVYTPPATLPLNQTATISARSLADNKQVFVFNFQIIPAISVSITTKFSTVTVGGPVQNLAATVTGDTSNAGVTWTITAGGVDCQQPPQGCGTLTVDPAPSLTAHYLPPTTPPSAANASPTITATSVRDPAKSDSFTFTIMAPAITVTITNKFASAFTGGQQITVNASLTNDFGNQGVTWNLTVGGAACTAACGTLIPVGTPSTSATYLPPPTPANGPIPSPTITATSVADPTKSDSFTFRLLLPGDVIIGNYVFLLRGYDQNLQPMALAGVLTADGQGNISGGELDLNDNTTVSSFAGPLSGTYTVDASFNGVPRGTFNIAAGAASIVLKCAFSADGKRAKVIEQDASFALNAGSMLQQDPSAVTALAASTSPISYAFGLDSDAPLNGRVVEAGQLILGAGAASVSGGIADEGQAGAAGPIFGGLTGAAPISAGSSSATAPDALGRGTLSLSIAGAATQYAYYIVDSSQFDLMETDTGGALKTLQAGIARAQKTLTAGSIQVTSVAALTGITSIGGAPTPNVIVGTLNNSAAGAIATAVYDQNNAGTTATGVLAAGTFTVPLDPITGRAVISGAFFPDAAVYLYDRGSGFMTDVTTAADGVNQGFSGPLMLQNAPVTGFTPGFLSGNSIAVGGATSSPSMANLDLAVNFDGAGNYSELVDFTVPNLAVGSNGQGSNFSTSGTYILDIPSLGHGYLTNVPSGFFNIFPSQADQMSFYLVGQNQFVAIESSGLGSSDIIFFDPQ